jgi:hypothetical protein
LKGLLQRLRAFVRLLLEKRPADLMPLGQLRHRLAPRQYLQR